MDLRVAAANETWAIAEGALGEILTSNARTGGRRAGQRPRARGAVVVIPIFGVISQRASVWQQIFGGTSTEQLTETLIEAANAGAEAIILNVDSPGGSVAGVAEAAATIANVSRQVRTYALANSLAASAAYWIASQVGRGNFFAAPNAEVGSIGVFRMHQDLSGMLEKEGVSVTFISTPEFKVETNPFQPLSDAARQHHQQQVDATYFAFRDAVAKGRGVTGADVDNRYGRGRLYNALDAYGKGMIDGIRSLGQLLTELGVGGDPAMSATSATARLELAMHKAWNSGSIRERPTSVASMRARLDAKTRDLQEWV